MQDSDTILEDLFRVPRKLRQQLKEKLCSAQPRKDVDCIFPAYISYSFYLNKVFCHCHFSLYVSYKTTTYKTFYGEVVPCQFFLKCLPFKPGYFILLLFIYISYSDLSFKRTDGLNREMNINSCFSRGWSAVSLTFTHYLFILKLVSQFFLCSY